MIGCFVDLSNRERQRGELLQRHTLEQVTSAELPAQPAGHHLWPEQTCCQQVNTCWVVRTARRSLLNACPDTARVSNYEANDREPTAARRSLLLRELKASDIALKSLSARPHGP